jgi:hypothetical protein
MPGARCTRDLVCKIVRRTAHEHTGSAETLRHPPRNGFTAYAVLSPATNSSCHRRCRLDGSSIRLDRIGHRQLDTSNGCQNHTVLPYASAPFVLRALNRSRKTALRSVCAPTLPRPPHPLPRFVTIAIRPSCRERMGRTGSADLRDRLSGILPVGLFCRSHGTGAALVGCCLLYAKGADASAETRGWALMECGCRPSRGDHPIQILRANSAVFMNRDALKSPITPTNSHFARSPISANTKNRGNETRLNLLIDTNPAGPPLSVR